MKSLDPNATRFKNLEKETETTLDATKPIIIRLDGKAFHSFTKQTWCDTPFSDALITMFEGTLQYLCENIQGCVLGYHQSDEITLVLTRRTPESEMFLGGRVQKIVSIVASMATMRFNELYHNLIPVEERSKPAFFDARVFQTQDVVEAVECVKWRVDDAVKNSKHMLARSMFSHRLLQKKTSRDLINMMAAEGVDYYVLPERYRCGSLCVRREQEVAVPARYAKTPGETVKRRKWVVEGYTHGTLMSILDEQ